MKVWSNGYIFQLTGAASLVCDHTNSFHSTIFEHEHISTLQVSVYHGLLLIGEQQQVDISLLIASDFDYFTTVFQWLAVLVCSAVNIMFFLMQEILWAAIYGIVR